MRAAFRQDLETLHLEALGVSLRRIGPTLVGVPSRAPRFNADAATQELATATTATATTAAVTVPAMAEAAVPATADSGTPATVVSVGGTSAQVSRQGGPSTSMGLEVAVPQWPALSSRGRIGGLLAAEKDGADRASNRTDRTDKTDKTDKTHRTDRADRADRTSADRQTTDADFSALSDSSTSENADLSNQRDGSCWSDGIWLLITPSDKAEAADELHVAIAGASQREAESLLRIVHEASLRALAVASRRVLLRACHETRQLDGRLLPTGTFALPLVHLEFFELHELLHADKQRALRALRSALQPFAFSNSQDYFVYRQACSAARQTGCLCRSVPAYVHMRRSASFKAMHRARLQNLPS
eukprot:2543451-Pleurochrysis_carterae.AAC.2